MLNLKDLLIGQYTNIVNKRIYDDYDITSCNKL